MRGQSVGPATACLRQCALVNSPVTDETHSRLTLEKKAYGSKFCSDGSGGRGHAAWPTH